jgi:hypothetical protein
MVRVGFNVTSSEIIGVFNTGVDNSGNLLPSGAVDSHYRIIGQFTAIGTPPVFPVGSVPVSMPGIGTQISGAASAYVARNEEWVPDGPSSKWLSPFVNTEGPPDLYLYETTFDLNGVDPNSAMLTGSWTVDDWAWMFVNGHLVSELPCYGTFLQLYGIQVYPGFSCSANHDFTVSNYFVSGTNKLDFVVWNGGGDGTGLRVEIKGMVNVDSLVTFSAQSSTYRTLNDTTGCPAGSAGKFTFTASLTNKPSSPSIADLSVRVATLTNGNVLLDAQTNAVLGGAGAVMPIPKQGMYSDGVLGPGELVDVPFIICLQTQQAFQFFVDVFASR